MEIALNHGSSMYDYADMISLNMPPERTVPYVDINYDNIQVHHRPHWLTIFREYLALWLVYVVYVYVCMPLVELWGYTLLIDHVYLQLTFSCAQTAMVHFASKMLYAIGYPGTVSSL